MALGMCPKSSIFKAYAELELQLGEVDRCRKIYERQVELFPSDSEAWIQYSEFEAALGEYERARLIYELAIEGKEGVSVPLD
jgi:crooked neck